MKITVIGAGKVGYYLSKTLIEHGHSPVIIEKDKKVCSFIANQLDIPVTCGDGTSLDILEGSGLSESDAIICVAGQDEINLVACQLAKKMFNVKKTIARVNNPKNKETLSLLGVDIVISSTDRIVEMLDREVDTSKIKEVVSLKNAGATIAEIDLPDDYALSGTAIMDLKLPESTNIISITRGGKLIIPRGPTLLRGGDILLVISENMPLSKLHSVFKLKI